MLERRTNRAIGQPEVDAPDGTENRPRRFRLLETLRHGPVAAHFAGREIAEPHAVAQRRVPRHRAANADLNVVRMWSESQEVNRLHAQRVHPNTSSPFSGAPFAARARSRAARKAPVTESPAP